MTAQTYNRNTIVVLLLAGAFIAILNQTTMITAIPPIMKEMNISANTAQWLTTVFMLVNGVMIPITAFLIERFSTRQLYITAMSIFAFGILIAGIAPNFSVLLLGRVIQSVGAGIMMPLMQTVFLLIYPVHKRGAAMGLVGLVIQFAPAIGPALSGWLISAYSWRVMFFVILPIALLLIGIATRAMKNVTELTRPKVDILSIILSSFGFGGLLYGFTCAGNLGWGNSITIFTLAIGVIALVLFIVRQLRLDHPMLEFRVFKYFIFTLTTGIGMLAFVGLIGIETLIPLYMQNMRGFTAMESGLAILPGALVMGLMSPITGRIFDKIGAKWLAITGLIIMALTTLPFVSLTNSTSFAYLAIYYSIRMFGLSMVMMPVTTAGLNQLPKRLIAHGTAMNNTMRQVSASIGTAILVTVMTTTGEGAKQDPTISNPMIHGVNVAFIVITVLSIVGVILAFFIKKTYPPEEAEKSVGTKEPIRS
ncbi:EmrB/QacA subfamily drug resistance transporter [Virgibacillus halotolerans]|uniref:DHA2 family efflux MFS transporter permease subunit n=1 Tax=Virgibacillus halotolerans TaxID=1071053 RepID=UPI0019618AAF|nr:DHA2 family efflux MFS transporter permease subunit [Virgibacillus halotolerans]MBM7599481.1 EmrB/QacA subfamily drug resistance transporter [Virgibacillus halotolerans]